MKRFRYWILLLILALAAGAYLPLAAGLPHGSSIARHLERLPEGMSWKSADTLHLDRVMARDAVGVANRHFPLHRLVIEAHEDSVKRVSGDLPLDPAQFALGLSERLGLDHIDVYNDGEIYLPKRPNAEECAQVSRPHAARIPVALRASPERLVWHFKVGSGSVSPRSLCSCSAPRVPSWPSAMSARV